MKKNNSVNRKVRFLVGQLNKCAKIGIALYQENHLLQSKVVASYEKLVEAKDAVKRVQETCEMDRNAHDAIVKTMGDKLNKTMASRNMYKVLFWSLVAFYMVYFVVKTILLHLAAK